MKNIFSVQALHIFILVFVTGIWSEMCVADIAFGSSSQEKCQAMLTTGENHSCAISEGKLACWGDNSYGQLGSQENGADVLDRPTLIYNGDENEAGLIGTANPSKVTAGSHHSCAIAAEKLYCWGYNYFGELGNDPDIITNTYRPIPLKNPADLEAGEAGLIGDKKVADLTLGGEFSCAIADERLYCWGANSLGQLGQGTTVNNYKASPILNVGSAGDGLLEDKAVLMASAGSSHICAIADGKLYCWGNNEDGQLGVNSEEPFLNIPSLVAGDMPGYIAGFQVNDVACGKYHTCAVSGGKLFCWGANDSGQLGVRDTEFSKVPLPIYNGKFGEAGLIGEDTVSAVVAGSEHTCAVAGGKLYCWGRNAEGQLGVGQVEDLEGQSFIDIPTIIYNGETHAKGKLDDKFVLGVNAGGLHTCATNGNDFYCWGDNSYGQLGNPTVDESDDNDNSYPSLATFSAPVCKEEEVDLCPDDPNKTLPGACGCGYTEDSNHNGIPDCYDPVSKEEEKPLNPDTEPLQPYVKDDSSSKRKNKVVVYFQRINGNNLIEEKTLSGMFEFAGKSKNKNKNKGKISQKYQSETQKIDKNGKAGKSKKQTNKRNNITLTRTNKKNSLSTSFSTLPSVELNASVSNNIQPLSKDTGTVTYRVRYRVLLYKKKKLKTKTKWSEYLYVTF